MNQFIKTLTVVVVLSFSSTAVVAETAAQGKKVFDQWCQGCHVDSPFAPGTIFLKATRGEKLAVIEKRDDLSAELVETMVRKGFGGMPSFRETEISDTAMQALVEYLTNK